MHASQIRPILYRLTRKIFVLSKLMSVCFSETIILKILLRIFITFIIYYFYCLDCFRIKRKNLIYRQTKFLSENGMTFQELLQQKVEHLWEIGLYCGKGDGFTLIDQDSTVLGFSFYQPHGHYTNRQQRTNISERSQCPLQPAFLQYSSKQVLVYTEMQLVSMM